LKAFDTAAHNLFSSAVDSTSIPNAELPSQNVSRKPQKLAYLLAISLTLLPWTVRIAGVLRSSKLSARSLVHVLCEGTITVWLLPTIWDARRRA
jgi:hypothetical protein